MNETLQFRLHLLRHEPVEVGDAIKALSYLGKIGEFAAKVARKPAPKLVLILRILSTEVDRHSLARAILGYAGSHTRRDSSSRRIRWFER